MSNDRDDDSSRLPPPVPVELPFSVAPPDDPPFDLQLLKQTITEVFTTFQPLQSSNQEMLAPTFFFLSRQFETLVSAVNNLNTTMIAQTITVTDMKLTVETQKEIVEQTIESQRQTTERLQKTLDIHTSKLSILARDAEKDDQPYDEKPLDDESTTRALYEMAVGKTKEKADRWNGRIDNTLIFVALFSAVVTGFAVMQTQFISPSATNTDNSSSNSTSSPPPLPASSDQSVCALYYLSLITSVCEIM